MHNELLALVFAAMTFFTHRPSPSHDEAFIAEAIATAIEKDAEHTPVTTSHAEDAALMVLYAWREGMLQIKPVPISWDAKSGRVCGVFQLDCSYANRHSVGEQAVEWLRRAHVYGLSVLSPDARTATIRERQARFLLVKALTDLHPNDAHDQERKPEDEEEARIRKEWP